MAKSRKPPQVVNFDGESLLMTRDIYQYSTRRRKTLLGRLSQMAQLDEAAPDRFAYQDERGRLLGFVTVGKGELWVDGNSVERANRISAEVLAACEEWLTFSRRAGHDEVIAEGVAASEQAGLVTDLDQPLEGLGIGMRELLADPDMRAQLQAQLPPGVDLSQLFGTSEGDASFPNMGDDDFDDDELAECCDGFRTVGLRLDLLGEHAGLYWMLKAPDWLTLGALHRVLSTLLGRAPAESFVFHFPDGSHDSQDKGETHPDRITLRRAFELAGNGFYRWGDPEWAFLLRQTRIFSLCRGVVELIRTEVYPPGDCSTPAEYSRRLKAGDLPRSEPFEVLERRVARYVDPTASRVGPYQTQGMSLPSVLFAVLLERSGAPATICELTHRAVLSDCNSEVTVPTVRRSLKKAPFLMDSEGRVSLDVADPAYGRSLAALEKFRAPDGPRLLARRFASTTVSVEGGAPDIILVVDDGPGLVHGCQVCHADEGSAPMLKALQEALVSLPEAVSVVLEDPLTREWIQPDLDVPIEFQTSVDAPVEPFLALEQSQIEQRGGGGYSFPAGLSPTELVDFCAAAQRYYLLSPWVLLSDSDVFLIEGLTPKPLVASIMGQADEVYGLSLFEGVSNFLRLRQGDIEAAYAFMDFIESPSSGLLRKQVHQAGVSLLDDDTCPFAYGIRQPATAAQFRILTEILNLVCHRIDERGGVEPGTTNETDSQGRTVRVTFPVDLAEAEPTASSSLSKPGRNDPCWCGSGKKYKKCHLTLDG